MSLLILLLDGEGVSMIMNESNATYMNGACSWSVQLDPITKREFIKILWELIGVEKETGRCRKLTPAKSSGALRGPIL